MVWKGFPGSSMVKKSACQHRRQRFNAWVGKRFPGEGNGNPLWYSCLGNPGTEESGELEYTGSQRVGHDLETEHAVMEWKP